MPSRTKTGLDEDEERVTRAQRLLIGLGAALVHTPFDTTTHDRLRSFLTDDADEVLTSLEALRRRPEAELRARIAELCGHSLLAEGSA
ncbi:hypothetical protein PV411_38240 [Streptomyces sp. NRRL_B-16638]|jgi:hypothetical protein|uniref:Uncharacterized protein n=2 Tax=Streptomyces coelicolor TaxID=1902 RepID=Q9AD08_STRCO|nr:hypothetical protein [Streptomyces sp. NRRL_B-16638]AGO88604.1 hypothetical protein [Streptomyces coelicolor]MDX2930333.1 hypothetical protein [Streptomyces sp. NRRL_B-16638]CAC36663.1 hypothetical protein [Streptomyces coelicolor A3(2)]